jgi:hypothetical protein
MEEEKGLIKLVEKLTIEIVELKKEQQKLVSETVIAKDISDRTDNVDNLRLIVKTMSKSLEYIVEKDSKLFDEMCEMLGILKEVFETCENMKSLEQK